MKKNILFAFILISSITFAQNEFLYGQWQFEKIPDTVEMDEKEKEMSKMFFKEMTLAMDASHYSLSIMGQEENGTWNALENSFYELKSSRGITTKIEFEKINDSTIIFKKAPMMLQLIKIEDEPTITKSESSLNKIQGATFKREDLLGTWINNGQIKNGKHNNTKFLHKEGEYVSYTFLDNGTFDNKSILGIELSATWKIDTDNQTILIESEELTESRKVVLINEKELHLYNPQSDLILKFVR